MFNQMSVNGQIVLYPATARPDQVVKIKERARWRQELKLAGYDFPAVYVDEDGLLDYVHHGLLTKPRRRKPTPKAKVVIEL